MRQCILFLRERALKKRNFLVRVFQKKVPTNSVFGLFLICACGAENVAKTGLFKARKSIWLA